MSSSRSNIFSSCAARRLRRPTLSFARLLLLLCLGAHALGQTFQYSRGWTNGRKRAFEPPAASEARRELLSAPLSATEGGDFADDSAANKQRSMPEGLGPMDRGRLEALLMILGNSGKEEGVEDGEELDMMKQKGLELGGRRKGVRGRTRSH